MKNIEEKRLPKKFQIIIEKVVRNLLFIIIFLIGIIFIILTYLNFLNIIADDTLRELGVAFIISSILSYSMEKFVHNRIEYATENMEEKVTNATNELKNMSAELDKKIPKIENASAKNHIRELVGNTAFHYIEDNILLKPFLSHDLHLTSELSIKEFEGDKRVELTNYIAAFVINKSHPCDYRVKFGTSSFLEDRSDISPCFLKIYKVKSGSNYGNHICTSDKEFKEDDFKNYLKYKNGEEIKNPFENLKGVEYKSEQDSFFFAFDYPLEKDETIKIEKESKAVHNIRDSFRYTISEMVMDPPLHIRVVPKDEELSVSVHLIHPDYIGKELQPDDPHEDPFKYTINDKGLLPGLGILVSWAPKN